MIRSGTPEPWAGSYSQRSGSLARASADLPVVMTSIAVVELFLGQQPQVSFRPRTVHLLSVPGPSPRYQHPADSDLSRRWRAEGRWPSVAPDSAASGCADERTSHVRMLMRWHE
jgi:hypothetical protein